MRPITNRPARLSSLLMLCALVAAPAATAGAEMVALVGGTLHPVSGPPIDGGTLVIDGDTIVAAGAGVEVPAGARVVDVAGKHLYPGFVHAQTDLGLVEVDSVPGTDDRTELGAVNPDARVEVAFNADSFRLPPTVAGGVVAAHVVPRGNLLAGRSAVMRLDGWNWRDMAIEAPAGVVLRWPSYEARGWGRWRQRAEDLKKEREEALRLLDELFENAAAYARAVDAARAGDVPAPRPEPRLAALGPVLAGELPLFVHASSLPQIEAALDWAGERGIERLVLVAGYDAARVAERLAAEEVPVILERVHDTPGRAWEAYDAPFTAAARLHEAGVRFALAAGGGGAGSENARSLPFEAATAVAHGLPREAALAAITLGAAEILGVGDRLGSLEAGKEASFFVADGDPLEIVTRIESVWIAGREQDRADDRQWRLYRKYDERPAGPADGGRE